MRHTLRVRLRHPSCRSCAQTTVLGTVRFALVMRVKRTQARLRRGVAGALGGNCKTLVVVTASPAAADTTETLQSLRFGEQCAKVRASACARTGRSLPSVCMPALAALIPASAAHLTTGGECRKGDAARPRRRSGGD